MATTAKTTDAAAKAKRTGLVTKNNATAMPKGTKQKQSNSDHSKNKTTVTTTKTKQY